MSKCKKLVGVSLDNEVVSLLETLCNEFGISKSQLVQLMVLKLGFNRFLNDGLHEGWNLSYHSSEYVNTFISEFDNVSDLIDLL